MRVNLGNVVGERGPQGADGRAIEISKSETHIQWRYVGDAEWINLIPLSDLQGAQGVQGIQGEPGVTGARGEAGTDGKSAFQTAVEAGYAGSEADFGELLASVQVVQTHPTDKTAHFKYCKAIVWGSPSTIALPLSKEDLGTPTESVTLLVEIAEELDVTNSSANVWLDGSSDIANLYGADGETIRDAHFAVGSFAVLRPKWFNGSWKGCYLLNSNVSSTIFTEALSEHDASDTAHRAQFLALASNKASSQRVDELEQEVALKANITDVYSKTEADNKFNVMVVGMEMYGTATSGSPQRYQADKTYAEIKAHIDNGGTAVIQNGSTIYSLTGVSTAAVEFATYGADYIVTIKITKTSTIFTPEETDIIPATGGTFTGAVKAPTAAAGTNTTQIATTAFVQTAISNAITNAIGGSY